MLSSAMYERMNQQRLAIRDHQYKIMREERRRQFISQMLPMASQPLQRFWNVRAEQLIFQKDAINECLRNYRIDEIEAEQQRLLANDLIFLCQHSQFKFTFPFRFHHNDDVQVCNFVCQYFYLLPPGEFDYWLDIMTIEDRKFVYLTFTEQNLKHLTKKFCQLLVEDLEYLQAAELLELLFDECPVAVNKKIMNMNLVEKMEQIMSSKKHQSPYINITSFIYLRNPQEGFSQHLLDLLFRDIQHSISYVRAITRILKRCRKSCLNMTLRKAVKTIERGSMEMNGSTMEMLIEMIENCRREGTEYTVQENTVKMAREMKATEETEAKYNKLRRLIIFNE